MSETTRTRAEIQAEIENVIEKAFAAGRACAVFEAKPCPITRDYSIEATIELDKYQCGLEKAIADLIPREECEKRIRIIGHELDKQKAALIEDHERALAEARADTKQVVVHCNARDAIAYLVKEYAMDAPDNPRTYRHNHDGAYRVTVERVEPTVADNATVTDAEPVGWANRHKGGAWSSMFLNATTARTCAEFGDWAETAVPLYRRPLESVAVAPKGVVAFLKDLEETLWLERRGALAEQVHKSWTAITELPEPSDCVKLFGGKAIFARGDNGRTIWCAESQEEALKLAANCIKAAALLERAKEAGDE